MTISAAQLTLLTMLVTGLVGAKRGWNREAVTAAIVLGTLLFVDFGGTTLVSNLLSGETSSLHASAAGGSCYSTGALSTLIFSGMTMIGYYAGNRHGAGAQTTNHRVVGMIPGMITGGAISYYVSQHLTTQARTLLNAMSGLSFLGTLTMVLAVGIVGVLVALFIDRGNRAGKAH